MVSEARLEQTENGLVPRGDGWFVVNAREAAWWHSDTFGSSCGFEGDVHPGAAPRGAELHVPR